MGLIAWLKAKVFKTAARPVQSANDQESEQGRQELAERLATLSREVSLDANARRFLTNHVLEARRQIRAGQSVLFGPDATLDQLIAEAAYQGLLDPVGQRAAKGIAMRDDLMMRVLVHYAKRGNKRSASGVKSFAAGTFNKRSSIRGTEQALRAAKEFVAGSQ